MSDHGQAYCYSLFSLLPSVGLFCQKKEQERTEETEKKAGNKGILFLSSFCCLLLDFFVDLASL
jgi:hypothetical protein